MRKRPTDGQKAGLITAIRGCCRGSLPDLSIDQIRDERSKVNRFPHTGKTVLIISGESWPGEDVSDQFANRDNIQVLMAHTIRDAEEMFREHKKDIAIVFLDGGLEAGSPEAIELVQLIYGDQDFTGQLVGTGPQLPSNKHRICEEGEMASVAIELLS
jgi:hypothetical protein